MPLSYIEAAHAIKYNECIVNICPPSMDELSAPRYITPMIVFSCQYCDEQQFIYLYNVCIYSALFTINVIIM